METKRIERRCTEIERGEEEGRGEEGERDRGKEISAAACRCEQTRSAFGGVSLGAWWNCRRDEGGGSWFCE